MKNSVLVVAKSIKGATFVAVRDYTNKEGEVSNQTFVTNIKYENCVKHDLEAIQNTDVHSLGLDFPSDVLDKAKEELIKSLTKPSENHSNAQKDAYTHLGKGIKMHNETGDFYITGLRVRKTVVKSIHYKEVKSRELTLAKKAIKKALDFKTDKFRNFKIGNAEELNLQGVTICKGDE